MGRHIVPAHDRARNVQWSRLRAASSVRLATPSFAYRVAKNAGDSDAESAAHEQARLVAQPGRTA